MAVQPIPEGYHTITPYLVVEDVAKLLEFVQQAFDAEVTERIENPDGAIAHAEVRIGDSMVMMGGARGDSGSIPAMLYIYVNDTDASYQRALAAGAESLMEPSDQFYGDRNAGVQDSQGNKWWIATHVEDIAPEEMQQRADEAFKNR